VVDDQHIHGLELAVQSQLLDGKAMKKKGRVLDGQSTMQEALFVGRWSIPA
jgi:hypothetical protein